MIYYQVYIDGQWVADFDTYEQAESFVNGNYQPGKKIEIVKANN